MAFVIDAGCLYSEVRTEFLNIIYFFPIAQEPLVGQGPPIIKPS